MKTKTLLLAAGMGLWAVALSAQPATPQPNPIPLFNCNSPTDRCNLVCNGNLEDAPTRSAVANVGGIFLGFHNYETGYGVGPTGNTPDLYWNSPTGLQGAGNTPNCGTGTVSVVNLNNSSVFAAILSADYWLETLHFPLRNALIPTTSTYKISMRVATLCAPQDIFVVLAENPPLEYNAQGNIALNDIQTPSTTTPHYNSSDVTAQGITLPIQTPDANLAARQLLILGASTYTASTPGSPLVWTTISQTFTANSANLDNIFIHLRPYPNTPHYVYIDDVRIEETTNLTQSIALTGPLTICPGQTASVSVPCTLTVSAPVTVQLTTNVAPFNLGSFNLTAGQNIVSLPLQITGSGGNYTITVTAAVDPASTCLDAPSPVSASIPVIVQPQLLTLTQTIVGGSPYTYVQGNFAYVTVDQTVCAPNALSGVVTGVLTTPGTLGGGWQLAQLGSTPPVPLGITPNQPFSLSPGNGYCQTFRYRYRIPKNQLEWCRLEGSLCATATPTAYVQGSFCADPVTSCITFPMNSLGLPSVIPTSVTTFSQAIQQQYLVSAALSTTTPQQVLIKGQLILDLPSYTFGGNGTAFSDVRMGSGAEIYLPSTVPGTNVAPELKLQGAYLHATCGVLWRGITLETGAKLLSSASPFNANQRTRIEDALYAIEARGKSSVQLTKTTFDKNYIGVHVPNTGVNVNHSVSFSVFSDNIFQGSANLLPDYPNAPELAGQKRSYAGMRLYRQSTFVISPTAATNVFQQLSNGIIAIQSTLTIQKARFLNIQPQGYVGIAGYGIYADGSGGNTLHSLTQKGDGMLGTPSFDRCLHGIFVLRQRLTTTENNMTNMGQTGVESAFASGLNVSIQNNQIEVSNAKGAAAVRLRLNDVSAGTATILVLNNRILTGKLVGSFINATMADGGIVVVENENPYGLIIQNNQVYLDYAYHGIRLHKNNGGWVQSNNVRLNQINYLPAQNRPERYGIRVEGGKKVQVLENGAVGTSSYILPQTVGISGENSIDSRYRCNYVDRTISGIKFIGDGGTSIVEGNTMYRHFFALHYSTQAKTGPQADRGNRWLGSYTPPFSYAAKHDDVAIIGSSLYFVPSSGSTQYRPAPTTISPQQGWFFYTGIPEPAIGCNIQTIAPMASTNTTDVDVALGNVPGVTPTSLWHLRHTLYDKLDKHPALRQDPLMQQFYTQYQPQPIAAVVQATDQRVAVLEMDAATAQFLLDYQTELQAQLDTLEEVDSLYALALLTESDWTVQRLARQAQIEALQQGSAQWSANWQGQRLPKSQQAQAVNQTIVPGNTPEENEQLVNEIYLNTIAIGNTAFTPAQTQLLYDIAQQCPLVHGRAVYGARSLYAWIDYSQSFENSCNTPQLRTQEDLCHNDVAFVNSSLEGSFCGMCAPSGWEICSESPDVYPGDTMIHLPASEGNTYAYLLGANYNPVYKESIGQSLEMEVLQGGTYKFGVDLAYASWYNGKPATLSIWLGNAQCQLAQQIYQVEIVDSVWKEHIVEFVPNSNYSNITFSVEAPQQSFGASALIDNLRPIPCGSTPIYRPESESEAGVVLYPNPNSGSQLTVEWALEAAVERIVVVDALGRVLGQYSVSGNWAQLPIADLPNGFYAVLLQSGERVVARKKWLRLR